MGCSPDLQAEEVHNTVFLAEPQGCLWLPWRLGMYWPHQTDAHGALACSDPTFCSHQLYSGVSVAQSGHSGGAGCPAPWCRSPNSCLQPSSTGHLLAFGFILLPLKLFKRKKKGKKKQLKYFLRVKFALFSLFSSPIFPLLSCGCCPVAPRGLLCIPAASGQEFNPNLGANLPNPAEKT